jgi:UDP-glucuronate 4-epimerase
MKKKLKKICVTGASGFIGFHTCKLLLSKGYIVHGIDSLNNYYDVNLKLARKEILNKNKNFKFHKFDISNRKLFHLLESINPNVIINLAAQAGVRHSLRKPHDYVRNNITSFLNILEYVKNGNENIRVVYASTSSVYGANEKMPFSEHDPVDHPLQFYAVTKRTNELMAHAYSNLYGIETVGLRFFTVYGPWGRPDMALFKFTKNIIEGKSIEVFNHGKHIRDFTYVSDIADGVVRAATKKITAKKRDNSKPNDSKSPFYLFNIGANRPVKLMKFINEIEKNLGIKAKIKFLPLQPGDVKETKSSIKNIKQVFNYKPSTNVEVGIKNFISWYLDYYK